MTRDLKKHLFYALVWLVLSIVVNRWFDLRYWPVILGVLIGTLLPDIDHLIYSFVLRPEELDSQRVGSLAKQKQFGRMVDVLYQTKAQRHDLIFHSVLFQLIFLALAILVVTSSASAFGGGLVLAVVLHLLIDQLADFRSTGNIANWFSRLPVRLPEQVHQKYLWFQALVLFTLTVLL